MEIKLRFVQRNAPIGIDVDGLGLVVMTPQECAQAMGATTRAAIIHTGRHTLTATAYDLSITSNPCSEWNGRGPEVMTIPAFYAKLDTPRFFAAVLKIWERIAAYRETYVHTLRIEDFRQPPTHWPLMGWTEIARHPLFKAKLNPAIVAAAKTDKHLRRILSRRLAIGDSVFNDGGTNCPDFFFTGHLTGGIIYHRDSREYSVHT